MSEVFYHALDRSFWVYQHRNRPGEYHAPQCNVPVGAVFAEYRDFIPDTDTFGTDKPCCKIPCPGLQLAERSALIISRHILSGDSISARDSLKRSINVRYLSSVCIYFRLSNGHLTALSKSSPSQPFSRPFSRLFCRKLSFAELYTLNYNKASLFLDAA